MVLVSISTIAVKVGCKAIQLDLKVSISFKSFADLGNLASNNLLQCINQVSFLIIDEYEVMKCRPITDLIQICHENKAYIIQTFNAQGESYFG